MGLFAYRKQQHPKLTPEIRRELQAARCRDVEMMDPSNEGPAALPIEMSDNESMDGEMSS